MRDVAPQDTHCHRSKTQHAESGRVLRRGLHALDDLFHDVCRAEGTSQPESFESGTVFQDRTEVRVHRNADVIVNILKRAHKSRLSGLFGREAHAITYLSGGFVVDMVLLSGGLTVHMDHTISLTPEG